MANLRSRKLAEAQRKDVAGLKMSDWDRENISKLIRFFDLAFPGVIKECIAEGRAEVKSQHEIIRKKSVGGFNLTRRAAIPDGLLRALKEGYPAIITDRQQFEQFLRWFPMFDLWKK